MGRKGTVIDVFNDFLMQTQAKACDYTIYACGRKQMLEVLCRTALDNGIKGYISTEENMACGIGACLGCAVKVKSKEQEN
jgi:dihydroorotate dehydrogenase electron transfer subunit